TVTFRDREPEIVARVVRAYARGAKLVNEQPDLAAEIASRYIGINSRFIREALHAHGPNVDALRSSAAMHEIQRLMVDLGYMPKVTSGFLDLSFLDAVQAAAA